MAEASRLVASVATMGGMRTSRMAATLIAPIPSPIAMAAQSPMTKDPVALATAIDSNPPSEKTFATETSTFPGPALITSICPSPTITR